MSLDLSALDTDEITSSGKPLLVELSKIIEDPNQPRTEFDEKSLNELADSIKSRGVKTPISIRLNPDDEKQYIINHGARRFKASQIARNETIPCFIDELHDEYDQVIENLQRDSLTPMELALFINKKIIDGIKKQDIAKSLSITGSSVTEHHALVDLPEKIEEIFSSKKCTSPKTLYELKKLHTKFPKDVNSWIKKSDTVTRKSVSELSTALKNPSNDLKVIDKSKSKITKKKKLSTTEIHISYKDKKAILALEKPSKKGLIKLIFTNGETIEVNAKDCIILYLKEK